jgi:hypothetical protein
MTRANTRRSYAAALLLLAVAACSDDAPPLVTGGAPVDVNTPTPSPTPVPTAPPSPTPTPCTTGTCEAPTTSAAPPETVEVRLYWVRIPGGNQIASSCTENDPIPVGYTFAVDLTARDANGKPTNGRGDVQWHYGGTEWMVQTATGHTFQPKHTVLGVGDFQVQAVLDGVASPWLHLTFTNDAASTPCSQP